MSLNDETERLNTAEEYLLRYEASTQEFDAALEHVLWVHKNKPECRQACAGILVNVVKRRSEDAAVMRKIKAIK